MKGDDLIDFLSMRFGETKASGSNAELERERQETRFERRDEEKH